MSKDEGFPKAAAKDRFDQIAILFWNLLSRLEHVKEERNDDQEKHLQFKPSMKNRKQ